MSKTTNRIITALFSVFIGGFFLLNLLLPDKDFSEKETGSCRRCRNSASLPFSPALLPLVLNLIAATNLPDVTHGSKQKPLRSLRRESGRITACFSATAAV